MEKGIKGDLRLASGQDTAFLLRTTVASELSTLVYHDLMIWPCCLTDNSLRKWYDLRNNRYEGEFEDDLYHGQGTLRLANGAVYKGGFEHGMYHGHGTLDTRELHDKADQTEKGVFEGMWEAGQRSGIGEWIADDGTKFKGMYAEDQFHGS